MRVIVYGEAYECAKAERGPDFARLYDEAGSLLEVFQGVRNFDGYTIEGGEWTEVETAEDTAREKRDQLLADTDYLMIMDYPITDEERVAVMAYRQALRDLPGAAGWPMTIVWPQKPACVKGSDTMYNVIEDMIGGAEIG